MRILHVINGVDSRAGGPTMAMAGLCKAQRDAGLDVSVLATFRAGQGRDLADDLIAHLVPVTTVGPTQGGLSNHPDLDAALRRAIGETDIVHAHGIWEQMQHSAARIARDLGKPYVITPHGMLTPWSLNQKWLKKKIYLLLRLRRDLDQAAAIHFTSSAERDATAPLRLKPTTIVEQLGVDLREFANLPPAGFLRSRFPQIGARRIVLFLGRLHPGKGMEYLIPALASPSLKDVALVAVGPDSSGFQASLEQSASAAGVNDRVIFTGMLRGPDRIAALRDADLFALPSEHENFGIVVVEALACGVPVVISDGVAIHGELTAANVGSSVPVADVPALAAEIAQWLSDEPRRIRTAQLARAFAFENFDWTKIGTRWRAHYAGLIGPTSPKVP